ncbi:MAG: nucleoside triphosphate pyrophosphohydrolase [Rhodospirillales bacterium]
MTDTTDKPAPISRLLAIMAKLRHPTEGCPWDREQSFATIAPFTIEEAYEVADAIAQNDLPALKEELGDLLFQVVFHARLAEEQGQFDFDAIAEALSDKMVRRHPHVFGAVDIRSADAQTEAWETQKAHERKAKDAAAGALSGVPVGFPALMRAQKLQKRASRVGFDWGEASLALEKVAEEVEELGAELAGGTPAAIEEELGDLLFSVVNVGRLAGADAETALRNANAKFERRFRRIEALLAEQGKTPAESTLAEMDALWDQAKHEEKS